MDGSLHDVLEPRFVQGQVEPTGLLHLSAGEDDSAAFRPEIEGGVEIDPAGFGEVEDRGAQQGLADRSDDDRGVFREGGFVLQVGVAEAGAEAANCDANSDGVW